LTASAAGVVAMLPKAVPYTVRPSAENRDALPSPTPVTRDEVVPVLEVASFAFVKNLAGKGWANAFDAVEFGNAGLVHVNSGKADCGVRHDGQGQNFFQHESTPED
jgi:hypothetical protein